MDIVDTFLNALQNKINASSGQISDFEEKKNQILEIKNIFYAHNLLKDEIDEKDLITFSSDEIEKIFAILDNEKKDLLVKTFLVYKPLVEMYEKIKEKFSGDFEAPQYTEAIKWLQDMAKRISDIVKSGTEGNEGYIGDLKDDSAYYNEYYNVFNGNSLVRPISDFKKFNELLDKLNFTDEEKYQIKKFVGISNIKLMSSYTYASESEFNKYKAILRAKRDKYNDLFDSLKEKNIEFENVNLEELVNEYQVSEYDLRQALCAVFFEQVFNKVNDGVFKVNEAVLELEKILDFSKFEEKPVEETVEVEEPVTEEVQEVVEEPKEEVNATIEEAKAILKNEKDLIESVNEEEFAKYLAQSLSEETEESIKYQIVSILISLHTEIDKYENVKELDHARKMIENNIRDYIDAYKTLKEKLDNLNKK